MPFASQLSIDGFALCQQAGIEPMTLVMGSSVFYAGSPSVRANMKLDLHRDGKARGVELTGISAAFNDAREAALQRLRAEASRCGAHAVLGVQLRRDHLDEPADSVEYVITGTAVRFRDRTVPAEPLLSVLSLQDHWQLMQAGYEPFGIAAASVVYETAPSLRVMRALAGLRYSEARATCELPELSRTVSGAIEIALARAAQTVRGSRAGYIVGVGIERKLEAITRENPGRAPLEREPAHRKDLRVTVHVLGSAIRVAHARERTQRGTWRELSDPFERNARLETVIKLISSAATQASPALERVKVQKGNADARRQQDGSHQDRRKRSRRPKG